MVGRNDSEVQQVARSDPLRLSAACRHFILGLTQPAAGVGSAPALGIKGCIVKPLAVHVLRSGYVVGKKEFRTVVELEAELIRLRTRDAHVVLAKNVSVRKVAAAVRLFRRRGISLGLGGVADA